MTDFAKDLDDATIYPTSARAQAAKERVLAAHHEMEAQVNREQQRADQAERTVAHLVSGLKDIEQVGKVAGSPVSKIATALLASPEVVGAADGWCRVGERNEAQALLMAAISERDDAERRSKISWDELAALKQEHARAVEKVIGDIAAERNAASALLAEILRERDAARAEVERLRGSAISAAHAAETGVVWVDEAEAAVERLTEADKLLRAAHRRTVAERDALAVAVEHAAKVFDGYAALHAARAINKEREARESRAVGLDGDADVLDGVVDDCRTKAAANREHAAVVRAALGGKEPQFAKKGPST